LLELSDKTGRTTTAVADDMVAEILAKASDAKRGAA